MLRVGPLCGPFRRGPPVASEILDLGALTEALSEHVVSPWLACQCLDRLRYVVVRHKTNFVEPKRGRVLLCVRLCAEWRRGTAATAGNVFYNV